MTAAATWDPCYCQAVCPWPVTSPPRCRLQKWQVISVFPGTPTAATQVAWTTPMCKCIRARGCGPRHAPGWSAAVHGSGGHKVITLTITADENCREIYFPGINNPNLERFLPRSAKQVRWTLVHCTVCVIESTKSLKRKPQRVVQTLSSLCETSFDGSHWYVMNKLSVTGTGDRTEIIYFLCCSQWLDWYNVRK